MPKNNYQEIGSVETQGRRTVVVSTIEGSEDLSIGQRVETEIDGKQKTIFLKNAIRLTKSEAQELVDILTPQL